MLGSYRLIAPRSTTRGARRRLPGAALADTLSGAPLSDRDVIQFVRSCPPTVVDGAPALSGVRLEVELPERAGPDDAAGLLRTLQERGGRVAGLRPRWKLARSVMSGSAERPSAGIGHDPASQAIAGWLAVARRAGAEYVVVDRRALADPPAVAGDTSAALQDLFERALRWRLVFEAYAIALVLHFPELETRATAAAMADLVDEVNSPYVGWAVTAVGGWSERLAILNYQAKAIYLPDAAPAESAGGRWTVRGWTAERDA
jgi:hypothetical protein